MIKFFRKIRYDLIEKNKTGKYLKYAIGEIILVVIGILIALYINNWNENLKLKQQEIQIYKEIKSDLIQTEKDIKKVIAREKSILVSTQTLLHNIREKKPFSGSIYNAFAQSGADFPVLPKTSGYENLKNIGLNMLSNDSIRISITDLFQLALIPLEDQLKSDNLGFNISNSLFPYQDKYLFIDYSKPYKLGFKHTDSINIYALEIKNYSDFLSDDGLTVTLQVALYTRSLRVNHEIEVINEIQKVLLKIDIELNELSN